MRPALLETCKVHHTTVRLLQVQHFNRKLDHWVPHQFSAHQRNWRIIYLLQYKKSHVLHGLRENMVSGLFIVT